MHIFSLQPQVESFFEKQPGIRAVVRIGSAGRHQLMPNSDLDYQLILTKNNEPEYLLQAAKATFGSSLARVLYSPDANKATLFFGQHLLACDLFFYQKEEELRKYFLGSEIGDARQAILFDREGGLAEFLQASIDTWQQNRQERLRVEAQRLIDNFDIRFEACSRAHGRSDGYRFSVLFGHALNAVVRLVWLAQGERQFDFMPPNFLTKYSHPLGLGLDQLGPIDLRTAHFQKKHLLQLFAEWAPKAAGRFGLKVNWEEKLSFLQSVMERDRFWNLRDAAKFNERLRPGLLFRSAAMSLMQPAEDVRFFFHKKNISAVIDLRAGRELAEHPYLPEQLGPVVYIHAPFDPWEQPDSFKDAHAHLASNEIIAYHFFLKCCRESVAKAFSVFAETSGAALVHCHAGKDRTGIVLTLLHLLSGADIHAARLDYLASEMDTRPELFDIILQVVQEYGGIEAYLKNCGITDFQIQKIRRRLCLLDFGRSDVEGGNRKAEIEKAGAGRPFRAIFRLPISHPSSSLSRVNFRLQMGARPKSSMPATNELKAIFTQYWQFMTLRGACRLNIFDAVAQKPGIYISALARQLQLHEPSLRLLILALESFDTMKVTENDGCRLTEKGELLTEGHSQSLKNACLLWGEEHLDAWRYLPQAVQSGKTAFELAFEQGFFEYLSSRPDVLQNYQMAMSEYARDDYAGLPDKVDFSKHRTVADIGGGYGELARLLAGRFPATRFVAFDRREVVGMRPPAALPNLQFIGGDFFKEMPFFADALILARVLHDWPDEAATIILKNCRRSLAENGRLYIIEILREQIPVPALDLHMALICGSRERTSQEYAALLSKTGFRVIETRPLNGFQSILIAQKQN